MKRFKTLFFSAIVVFAFFGIMELLCRSFNITDKLNADFKFYIHNVDNDLRADHNREDALLMWSPLPYYDDGKIKINSAGFNDKEYPIKKERGTIRILCLGDSSTFRGTYHSVLEEMLNKYPESRQKRFEVINAGVTGYTSYQGLCMYKYKGAQYDPDIVTFYFGINDPIKKFYLSDKQIMQEGIPVFIKVIKNRFLLKSDLYRVMRKMIYTLRDKGRKGKGEKIERVSLSDYRQNIIELYKLSKRDNFELILISPPLCKEAADGWEKGDDIIKYRRELEDVAEEYNIPLLEIEEMTEKSKEPTRSCFSDAIHPNESGHRLIAQRLYDCLHRNELIPPLKESRLASAEDIR